MKLYNYISKHSLGNSPAASLAVTCLLLILLAFQSCDSADPLSVQDRASSTLMVANLSLTDPVRTKAAYAGYENIRKLHLFVFNDDEKGLLDSYISCDRPATPYITFDSSVGDKIAVMVANLDETSFSINDISTYEALESVRADLKNEDPAYPVMCGECQFSAGEGGYTALMLTPLLSEICLDFLKVNFSGKGYRSTTLENASAFLTNVSGSAEVLRHDGFKVTECVNAGKLDTQYLSGMKHPELLRKSVIPGYWKPVSLYCYPNDSADGVLGSEHTRLVIQGDIDGRTYYYPIEINQEGYGYAGGPHGVSRNIKYSYGLTITRKGSTDPSVPVAPETTVDKGWINLHPGQFITGKTGDVIHVWCELYPEYTELDIDKDDLDYDVERGIYSYVMDKDGHGVTLTLKDGGTGMFTIDAGSPVDQGFLVMVVVNP